MTLKEIKKQPFQTFAEESQVRWKIEVKEPVVNGERLLVVDFLRNKNNSVYNVSKSSFRLICAKKGKWVQAVSAKGEKMNEVFYRLSWAKRDYVLISEKEEKRLQRFAGIEKTGNHQLDNLEEWATETREEMKRREREKRGEFQDDDYLICPEALPEGLVDFIRRVILPRDKVLLYKKGNVKGLCYQCGHEVRATYQRFTQYSLVYCPHCGTRVTCILESSNAYKTDRVGNVIALQKGTDGETVFFRQWAIMRDPTARWEKVEPFLKEIARYAVRGRKTAKWLKEAKEQYYLQSERYDLPEWTKKQGNQAYDYGGYFYGEDANAVLRGSRMQYAPLEEYLQDEGRDPRLFLTYFAKYPVMEFLWKGGYRKAVHQRINGMDRKMSNAIYWERGKLKDCFKFPLHFLKIQPPEKWTLAGIAEMNALWKNSGGMLTEKDASAVIENGIDEELIKDAMKYASAGKIAGYIKKQAEKKTGGMIAYRDYIQECEQLNLDLTQKEILFPANLNAAHERTMAQVNFEKNKAEQEKFEKVVSKLEKFSWAQDGFIIRPAREQIELTAEGQALHHCVGGYIKRMANGETAIFFLRKKENPDEPFFTLELRNKRVIQCRTDHNRSYESEPDVKAFVDMWIKKVVEKGGVKRVKEAAA